MPSGEYPISITVLVRYAERARPKGSDRHPYSLFDTLFPVVVTGIWKSATGGFVHRRGFTGSRRMNYGGRSSQGRLAPSVMTEGVDLPSRVFVGPWKNVYALSPWSARVAGPCDFTNQPRAAGLTILAREVMGHLGAPSEELAAARQTATTNSSQ